jgi:hypothetical protein
MLRRCMLFEALLIACGRPARRLLRAAAMSTPIGVSMQQPICPHIGWQIELLPCRGSTVLAA